MRTFIFCNSWGKIAGKKIEWINQYDGGPHEANMLKLDCSRIKRRLGWYPRRNIEKAVEKSIELYYVIEYDQAHVADCMDSQINQFYTI